MYAMSLLELPNDVLCCICDFSGTALCSHASSRLWKLLQQRHLHHHIPKERDFLAMMTDLRMQAVRTAALDFIDNYVGSSGAEALAGLKDAGILHTLTLNLARNNVGDRGVEALADLKNAGALHTLTLDLGGNDMGDRGAEALAELKNAAALRTLTLDLSLNNVGDSGAQALARLKNAAALHTLTLDP